MDELVIAFRIFTLVAFAPFIFLAYVMFRKPKDTASVPLQKLEAWARRAPRATQLFLIVFVGTAASAVALAAAIAPRLLESPKSDAAVIAASPENAVNQAHQLRAQVALIESNRALAAATRVLAQQLEKTQRPESLPMPPAPHLP